MLPSRYRPLALLFVGFAAPLLAADSKMFDLPYHQRELDNGLMVYIVPTDHQDLVSLQLAVGTGSRNEVEPGKSGFAHCTSRSSAPIIPMAD